MAIGRRLRTSSRRRFSRLIAPWRDFALIPVFTPGFTGSRPTWPWIVSRKRQTLREEISYEADTAANPDRPALKDTLEEKSYYSNPERRLYGREVGAKIQEALKTLSEKERLVFELRHYQGLRLRMIGEIMGSTEETAKNYLFRATQKLRAYLSRI